MSVNDLIIIGGLSETTIKNYLIADIEQYSHVTSWLVERGIKKERRLESLRKTRRFKI